MSATPFHLDSACLPRHRLAAFEQNILDGIQDLLLVLAPDGRVLHASRMCLALTTLTPEYLVGNHIATFMHYDDLPVFLDEFKASLRSGQPWRFQHRLRKADDTFAVFESTFNPFIDTSEVQTAGFHGLHKCIMTVRPYLHPSVVLLDSYLDHITTQARLIQQLEDLRSEAEVLIDDDDDEEQEGEAAGEAGESEESGESGQSEEEKEVVDEFMMQKTDVCAPNIANTKKKVSSILPLLIVTDLLQDPRQIRNQQSLEQSFTESSPQIRLGQRSYSFESRSVEAREDIRLRRYRNPNHCLTPGNDQEDRIVGSQTMRSEETEKRNAPRPYLHSVRNERISRVAYRISRQKDLVQCMWT